MHLFFTVFLVLHHVLALSLESSFPGVFYNGQKTPVSLTLVGAADALPFEVASVRTYVYKPSKRGPKLTGSVPHSSFVVDGASVSLEPVYGMSVKDFEIAYGVEVVYENGDKEWVDGATQLVTVKDAPINTLVLVSAIAVASVLFSALFLLVTRVTPQGYWDSLLPKRLHFLLPEKPKKA